MLLGLFLFGTYSFWIIIALVSFFLFACVEKIWTGWATIVLACTVSTILISNEINPLPHLQEHPFDLVKWVALYALIGAIWSVYRWYVFLLKRRDEVQKIKREFLRDHHIEGNAVPDELKEDWLFALSAKSTQLVSKNPYREHRLPRDQKNEAIERFLNNKGRSSRDHLIPEELKADWEKEVNRISREVQFTLRPRPRDHKGLITLWMIYWPWSMAWYILNDPIKRFANWIYRRMQKLLEAISEHVWKDVKNDLPPTDI